MCLLMCSLVLMRKLRTFFAMMLHHLIHHLLHVLVHQFHVLRHQCLPFGGILLCLDGSHRSLHLLHFSCIGIVASAASEVGAALAFLPGLPCAHPLPGKTGATAGLVPSIIEQRHS